VDLPPYNLSCVFTVDTFDLLWTCCTAFCTTNRREWGMDLRLYLSPAAPRDAGDGMQGSRGCRRARHVRQYARSSRCRFFLFLKIILEHFSCSIYRHLQTSVPLRSRSTTASPSPSASRLLTQLPELPRQMFGS